MNNPILQFAPYLTFAIVFLILLEIPICLSDWRTDCSTQFICGNTEASFPFWGNQRPYGCGIPELELRCANDTTSLRLNNVTYRVLQLNQATRILNIAREDFMTGFCSPNFVNTTLDPDLFEYIPGYTNLTFVYGCPTSLRPSSLLFNCNVNGPLFETGLVQPGATGPGLCYSSVYVPVSVSLAAVLNLSALKNDLPKGFEVRRKIDDTECNNCISSKGACGYDLTSNQTTCYCRGQSSGSTTCSASSSSPDSKPAKARFRTAITIAASVIGSVMLFCIVYCLIRRGAIMKHGKTMLRRKKNQKRVNFRGRRYQIEALEPRTEPDGSEMITVECLQFDLGAIESATKKFSAENKLGRGGFGEVYKGTLSNGQEIAVKRLLKSSAHGAEEFKNEVLLVAKLQHRNLTRLLGFCLEGEETILIYEYVPNRSLDYFLFNPKMQGHLDWSTRQKIIGGIARGILYLHEDSLLKIIHHDLKAGNILLDKNMNPKISDFGLARLFGVDQIEASTNRIVGTYYMSPEYAMHGQFSVKSDVYSFGVLLLEIVSGKNNSSFYKTEGAEHLVSYVSVKFPSLNYHYLSN